MASEFGLPVGIDRIRVSEENYLGEMSLPPLERTYPNASHRVYNESPSTEVWPANCSEEPVL